MSCKVEACAECTQRCIQLHRKMGNLPSVTSFFKVMIGDLFPKVLYWPPKFAAAVPTMANKKVVLEDSIGQQWQVTVSNHEGALAFGDGWSAFSSEHSLEIGDIVIFDHNMDLHFNVKIYTKTGCEKVELTKKRNSKKRTSAAFETADKGFTNPQASSTSVSYGSNVAVSQDKCGLASSQRINVMREKRSKFQSDDERLQTPLKTENFDDSYNFISQNRDVRPEENRRALVDLFSMEMQKNNNSSKDNATYKATGVKLHPTLASTSLGTAIAAGSIRKVQIVKEENSQILPLNKCNNERIEKGLCPEAVKAKTTVLGKDSCRNNIIGVPFVTSAGNSDKKMEHFHGAPLKEVKECQNIGAIFNTPSTSTRDDLAEAVPLEKPSFPTKYCPSAILGYTPSSLGVQKFPSGEVRKIIKDEPLETSPEVESQEEMIKEIWEPKVIVEELIEKTSKIDEDDNGDVHKVVKTGNGDSVGISSPGAAHIFSSVATDTPFFLVLPTSLPTSKKGKRHQEKKKVVYLCDPKKRLWPVFYHEMPEIQVLTSGWEAFSSANQIKQGDECLFSVKDEFERIYEVIIRKCNKYDSRFTL